MGHTTEDFAASAVVKRADEPLSATLDGEAVLLEPDDGEYFGLNDLGTQLWELLESPKRVADLQEWMLERFEVEDSIAERDLQAFLSDLLEAGLIEVRQPDDDS